MHQTRSHHASAFKISMMCDLVLSTGSRTTMMLSTCLQVRADPRMSVPSCSPTCDGNRCDEAVSHEGTERSLNNEMDNTLVSVRSYRPRLKETLCLVFSRDLSCPELEVGEQRGRQFARQN